MRFSSPSRKFSTFGKKCNVMFASGRGHHFLGKDFNLAVSFLQLFFWWLVLCAVAHFDKYDEGK